LKAADGTAIPCLADNLSEPFVDYMCPMSVSRKDVFMPAPKLKCLTFTRALSIALLQVAFGVSSHFPSLDHVLLRDLGQSDAAWSTMI
jgi:hypothetical protein